MQHSQRLDQRLHMLRDEVRTMTREKERGERGERVWRERLQRCQTQLKDKDEEMSRQSQYFHNFKSQLQQKLSLARDREQSLQSRIYTLEKRLLDVTVSAATGVATIGAARITGGTAAFQEEKERLTSMRGEGEGEEERREERMRKCQPGVSPGREGGREGDEGQGEKEAGGGANDTRLQGFILSLQEDLRVLLERGEDGLTERRELMEQLSEAQENGHFLSSRVEEMKAEVQRLRLSERSLAEEVEELREENDRLQLILREAANQTANQPPSGAEDAEVQPSLTAVPPDHHQAAAEFTQRAPDSKPNLGLQSLSSETIDEWNLETWSRRGILDLEQVPSDESDALRDAFRSLGLGEDLEDLREQRDRLDGALRRTQEELEMVAQENTQLKLQLREQAEEGAAEQSSSEETDNNSVPAPDPHDLARALNQENRALAERIEELMAHMELREAEVTTEQSHLREQAARMEEENQEQGCLITELTRKTEDDLNTIMELQQKLDEKQSGAEESVDNKSSSTQTDEHRSHHQEFLLTKTVQGLKTEEEQLIGTVTSLREQQEEVAQWVQTKTEEKQQLTRTVWGLKEEKDRLSQCLVGLRQEQEQLTRTVCGLRDNRDHFLRSMRSLQEEKEQLTQAVSRLEREKEEQLSSRKEEQDEMERSFQSLTTEREQLHKEVLHLKQEKEEITTSLQCLREQTDDQERLRKTRKNEEERAEHSVTRLRREEMTLMNQSLEEEGRSSDLLRHTQESQSADLGLRTRGQPAQRSLQEQREAEALESKLTRSQEELEKSRTQTKRLQSELSQSEVRREEAERRAEEAGMRLTEAANQTEETRRDNRSLSTQVKTLQSKVSDLHRERTDALSLKTQTEEQHNVLSAQLKAKTVALDELNAEYIALKRGQGNKNDLAAALVSVRTRYDDIRAKHDALLRKRSETHLDTAPLKAKLSCLVAKCQERNRFIAAVMETMRRRGCADATISQQGELLLADAALLDYAAAFTPRFISTLEDQFTRDENCPAPSPASHLPNRRLTPDAGGKHRDLRSDEVSSSGENSTNITNAAQQVSLSPVGPIKDTFGLNQPDLRGKSSPDLTSSPSPSPPSSSGTRRRLSSPEKIISLHEQLQKTLMSRYQAPASRGRGEDPRRSLSASAPADLNLTCELSFSKPRYSSLPSHQTTPTGTVATPAADKTLFNAVAARAARVSFGRSIFPRRHFTANTSKTSTSDVSGSSDETETETVTVPPAPDTSHSPSALGTSCDSNVSVCPDTDLTSAASETAAPGKSTAPKCPVSAGSGAREGPAFTASWTRPGPRSPETRSSLARKSSGPGAPMKLTRPRPDAPAEVRSVEVIRTVGQSSLLIGWERPALDELGCSNGTFVYGYRVFVDGDFHKSVMSSACTKCVAENVDLSVPIDVGVQTLGSNGLSSNSVHTVFRAEPRGQCHL